MVVKKKSQLLTIVPCGLSKIWDKKPDTGPTLAKDTYQGAPFKVNRQYAEQCSDRWIILSAKYGFISPDFVISGPYEVTFKRKSTNPVTLETLRIQIHELGLDKFGTVIGLGGKEYRDTIANAFKGVNVELRFPFAGLTIGKAMQATKNAIATI